MKKKRSRGIEEEEHKYATDGLDKFKTKEEFRNNELRRFKANTHMSVGDEHSKTSSSSDDDDYIKLDDINKNQL